jgi:hypothetical protein
VQLIGNLLKVPFGSLQDLSEIDKSSLDALDWLTNELVRLILVFPSSYQAYVTNYQVKIVIRNHGNGSGPSNL